ncbi:MAG: trypsin-like peptidase domain-containing protein [Deltaproteobacteria bacterium]|nr:trypsin-like peptidase domain-containing protein [Deltaproteobacteria bacterium]
MNLGLVAFFLWGPGRGAAATARDVASGPAAPAASVEDAQPRPVTPRGDLAPSESAVVDLFDRASRSVAYITTLTDVRDRYSLYVHRVPQGTGSGFVWDADGHVVTNFHVIAEAQEAVVTLSGGQQYQASLVGVAPDHDLAVLKIEAPAEELAPLAVGTSKDLRVGQFAMAIGNPFGLDQTLTTGVVSALDREIDAMSGRRIYGVIQTDAAVNPGNSGGPLLDSAGRLIGVNTAIKSPSGASAGIGFAVPVDTVNRVVPQIIKFGRASRPSLGVSILSPSAAQRLGLGEGVIVRDVVPGSPAADAGLQGLLADRRGRVRVGDVIVGLDDTDVKDPDDLLKALDTRAVGDEVTIKLLREGAGREVKLRLAAGD